MLSAWIVSLWMLCLSLSDIRSKNVSVWLVWGGGALALAVSFVENLSKIVASGDWQSYIMTVFCGAIPGLCMLLLAVFTKAVGSGDGAVLILFGAVVGFQKILLILCVGLFLAALGSVVLLVIKKANRNTCLPFLPFVAIGWFVMLIE